MRFVGPRSSLRGGIGITITDDSMHAMNPERWQKVEALYRAALECGRQDRAALMARADPELRRDVEALLAQEETAAMETMVDALTQLGPYKIEAPLGAGWNADGRTAPH